MQDTKAMRVLRIGLLFSGISITLWMAPYSSLDPVSLPKMSLLLFLSFSLTGLWLPGIRNLIKSDLRGSSLLVFVFIAIVILVTAFSGAGIVQQIFGTFGRNTGSLTYIALALLMFSSIIATDRDFLKRFIMIVIFVSLVLVLYGQLQFLGRDPWKFTNIYASNVFGTLGNPNFMASFLGMCAVVVIAVLLGKEVNKRKIICLSILFLGILLTIWETHSIQGFLCFIAGVITVFALWLFLNKKLRLAIGVAGIASIGGVFAALALVNIGPLAPYLFKSSLATRAYYWRAALNMLLHHPLTGVGMDGFGEHYRQERNLEDTLTNPDLSSDTAHNVFLDVASNGGFSLLLIYFALVALVIVSIAKVIRRNQLFNPYFSAAVGAWTAYQAQSLISINQIGLAIWGWILSGLIIGYEISTRNESEESPKVPSVSLLKKNVKVSKNLSAFTVVSLFASTLFSICLAIPPFVAANKFYGALKSGNPLELQPAAYLKPYDRVRFTFIASNLSQNNLNDKALVVIRDAVKLFPNSYEAWKILAQLPNASAVEVALAKAEMKRLDPFNPNLK